MQSTLSALLAVYGRSEYALVDQDGNPHIDIKCEDYRVLLKFKEDIYDNIIREEIEIKVKEKCVLWWRINYTELMKQ